MRAMVIREAVAGGELAMVDRPTPTPGPGQVLVQVVACGVCRTDLHELDGDLPGLVLPRTPGHQVVGQVVDRGPGVTSPAVGDRVGVAWLGSACGQCPACRSGHENLCPHATFTGFTVDGGYAEYVLANADFVYPLPADWPEEELAPLLCAGVIGYRALCLASAEPGGRLGLFGFGASAHLTAQLAVAQGLEVHAFSRSEAHRRLARELGAAWAGAADDPAAAPLDAAVLFAPVAALVPQALARLRPGGTLVVNAIHTDEPITFPFARLYGERTLRSVTNATRADGREFLRLAAVHGLRPRVETYPLAAAGRALDRVRRAELQGAAVLTV